MQDNGAHKVEFNPAVYIGREIKGITLIELIGRGAMGAVYVGFQQSLKRKVAVKIFPKTNSALPFLSLQFRDEAETVAVLSHPHIAPVFDMGETEDLLFMMMQLIEGEDLKTMLHHAHLNPIPSRRNLAPLFVLDTIINILDALDYAHREGVVHEDIKPGNIIIESRSKRAFLVDFGIAHSSISEADSSSYILGTPLYMAPEQISTNIPDFRSDIYSCGVVLFEALAGKLPVKSMRADLLMEIKQKEPDQFFTCNPSQVCAVITPDIEKIIFKATAGNPDQRYQSCTGFKRDLERVVQSMRNG